MSEIWICSWTSTRAGERLLDPERRRNLFVLDLDQRERLLGELDGLGRDGRDGIARIPRAIDRQHRSDP